MFEWSCCGSLCCSSVSTIKSWLRIFQVNHSNHCAASLVFESYDLVDVRWAILQNRVLISAANVPLASLLLLPAHTADDNSADYDSGHHSNDN